MTLDPQASPPDVPPSHLSAIDEVFARYGITRTAPPVPVAASVLNENYHVETSAGPRFVRFHKKSRTRERLLLEHDVIRWAAKHGIPVNEPLADTEGRTLHSVGGRLVAVFSWLEGRHRLRGTIGPEDAATMADMLGRIHATLSGYDRSPLPYGKVGSIWDTRASIENLSRVDDVIRYYPAPSVEQLRIQAALRVQLALLESNQPRPASDFASLALQPCHGDYHNGNVILAPTGGVLAVVDWEMVSLLPPVFELLRFLTFSRLLEPGLIEASLTAYRRHAPLVAADCALGVETWWQALLHDTWVYTARFIQGARNVEQFFPESADHIRRFSDPAYRAELTAMLVRHAT